MEVRINPKIFNEIYFPYLHEQAETQIMFGGSGSGKSVFKAQQAVIDVLGGKRNYLVCRKVGRSIRGSVSQEIQKFINGNGLSQLFSINKTDNTITCQNGKQIIFSGLDDVEKLKSITPSDGVLTDIWVEEATEIEEDDLRQLEKRLRGGSEGVSKRIHLTFNPILQSHWIYQRYFSGIAWADDQKEYKSDNLVILKTTYKDNRFMTAQDKARLESEKDEYHYSVYTLGNWGILGGVIFTNWETQDLTPMMEQFTNHRNGLDFGFASDPAALVVTHWDKKNGVIYIYDELYERGLTNDILSHEIIGKVDRQYVTCDSAEPKSIQELINHGVSALAAKKGKDSVQFGIQWLQQQRIIVHSACINMRNELSVYHWKKDKNGNDIRVPADNNNHLIDGLRYGYEGEMIEYNLQPVYGLMQL